jgi:hypothetical protein
MAEDETTEGNQSIDYDADQATIDKAKQAAHDEDSKRLAEEHPDKPS